MLDSDRLVVRSKTVSEVSALWADSFQVPGTVLVMDRTSAGAHALAHDPELISLIHDGHAHEEDSMSAPDEEDPR